MAQRTDKGLVELSGESKPAGWGVKAVAHGPCDAHRQVPARQYHLGDAPLRNRA